MPYTKPLFNYVGGKQRYAKDLVPLVPKEFGTYFEPFAGGAAMFFALGPKRAWLNDLFQPLAMSYAIARETPPETLIKLLEPVFAMSRDEATEQIWRTVPQSPLELLRMAYAVLNLGSPPIWACNPGTYMSHTMRRQDHDGEGLQGMRARVPAALGVLQACNLTITSLDFMEVVQHVGPDDFAFLDPPYFGGYANPYADRVTAERLLESLTAIDAAGAKLLLTLGGVEPDVVPFPVVRVIKRNSNQSHSPVTEYVYANYDPGA